MAIEARGWTIGDRWPYMYFRMTKTTYDAQTNAKKEPMDLASEFSELRFHARREGNMDDLNNHSLDDINTVIVIDGIGLCHYAPAQGDTDLGGVYYGRVWGTRTDTKVFHSKTWFKFTIGDANRFGTRSL